MSVRPLCLALALSRCETHVDEPFLEHRNEHFIHFSSVPTVGERAADPRNPTEEGGPSRGVRSYFARPWLLLVHAAVHNRWRVAAFPRDNARVPDGLS